MTIQFDAGDFNLDTPRNNSHFIIKTGNAQSTGYKPSTIFACSATCNSTAINDNLVLQRKQIHINNKI